MGRFLGIDASTQSLTALVMEDTTARIEAQVSVNFGRDLPRYGVPNGFTRGEGGAVLADPLMWLEGLDLCLERLRERTDMGQIVAIGGAGQQHGTVYLSADGLKRLGHLSLPHVDMAGGFSRPLSPIWMDQSTTQQCGEIEAGLGGALEVCRRSGSVAIERFSGPQIRRFAQTEPAAYTETARVHLVSSFMASVLAGMDAPIDRGDGAGMNLLNLETWDWDEPLLAATAAGLRARLPRVVPSDTVLGPVAPWLVRRHGFSPSAMVVAFTGDNPASLVGMGDCLPHERLISLGTSDTIFGRQDTARPDPGGCGHLFGHPLGGTMALQCFVNGSLARERVREALGMDWEAFSDAVMAEPAGNDGFQLLPFFEPEISPRIPAGVRSLGGPKGGWEHSAASARACVEGQILNIRLQSRWIGAAPRCLYLTGGASANQAIAQTVADVFQAPVHRISSTESVAMGGAVLAAMAVGSDVAPLRERLRAGMESALEPRAEAASIYEEALLRIEAALGSPDRC
jgi:xylulokinase